MSKNANLVSIQAIVREEQWQYYESGSGSGRKVAVAGAVAVLGVGAVAGVSCSGSCRSSLWLVVCKLINMMYIRCNEIVHICLKLIYVGFTARVLQSGLPLKTYFIPFKNILPKLRGDFYEPSFCTTICLISYPPLLFF
jgi:hypothetical protein